MSGTDTFSEYIEGEVLEINPGAIQSPDTLTITMTRGERHIARELHEWFGAFKRVVIDLDGERHESSADSLIRLLEGYEGARDTSEVGSEVGSEVCSTRWQQLFGTPERAARTVIALETCRVVGCEDCAARGVCRYQCDYDFDYDALLEWLRGDA